MSLPDDWSGFAGPVPDIKLFGSPLHGRVTRPYNAVTGESYIELHMPNGTTVRKASWTWPNLAQNTQFVGYHGLGFDFSLYGIGGTCYYWKRPGIGPVPSRTPEQQADDAARGHQWRNDRINARWVWCDDAGDRWTVSINPSVGGSGLTRNYNITLRLAGALNEPAITRSMVVAITDPADAALPDDFYGRADSNWELALQDVHPDGGKKALFGISREPIDWAAPYAVEDYGWFPLFYMTSEQHDDILKLPVNVSHSFREPYYPRKVLTAHIEILLSGAARSGAWTATPDTVLTRAQTAGTYSFSGPPAPLETSLDVCRVWARSTTPAPPTPNEANPYYETLSGIGGEMPAGSERPSNVSATQWNNRQTLYRGAGSCSVAGSSMVVGVFYGPSGDVAVVSTDIDYHYSHDFSATVGQSGSMTAYISNGDQIFSVTSDSRVATRERSQLIDESAEYRIRVNGVLVHTVSLGAQIQMTSDVTMTYDAKYRFIAGGGVVFDDLFSSVGGTEYGISTHTDELVQSGSFTVGAGLHEMVGAPWWYSSSPLRSWLLRYGPKSTKGANPTATNFVDAPLGAVSGPRSSWSYNLSRCSNNTFQLRGGAYRPTSWDSVRIGPVICPAGAVGGVLSIPKTVDQLPPLCCSYDPFTRTVVQDIVPTTFI